MSDTSREPTDAAIFDEKGEPRRTILVVDDTPMFREIETVFLGRTAKIVTASDGTEALRIVRTLRPDLVLADLTMRELNGDDLCRQLRGNPDLRRTPVVIVTSGRSAEEHERAVRAGADDVVEKPLNRVLLLQVVNRLLRLTVRGLARVPLETEVHLQMPGGDLWGWSRNISRGGMFVEADRALEPDTELDLEFQVPETEMCLRPTARVVWRRPLEEGDRPGMGLQFLKLERSAARWLEEYVYERAPVDEPGAPTAESASAVEAPGPSDGL
jgi:uncharacterized protein (TIGR02266 family)